MKFQWTAPLIFRTPTNKTPTLAISCITDARPPLMEGSDISLMNIGATKAYAHPLIPEKNIVEIRQIFLLEILGDFCNVISRCFSMYMLQLLRKLLDRWRHVGCNCKRGRKFLTVFWSARKRCDRSASDK